MSATRDPSEKITFLFSPMAGLVRKIKETPVVPSQSRPQSRIIARPAMAVREHRARDLTPVIPKAAATLFQPAQLDTAASEQRAGLAGLQKSLGELDQLQKRFRFLIQELEDLIQD